MTQKTTEDDESNHFGGLFQQTVRSLTPFNLNYEAIPLPTLQNVCFDQLVLSEILSGRVGVPARGSNELERSTYGVLPDACVSDEFAVGDTVWSAKYHSSATVKAVYDAEYCNSKKGLGSMQTIVEKYGAELL